MTQKEKLYEQVLINNNEYYKLSGESEKNIDELKKRGIFEVYVKNHTLAKLKESLARSEARIEAAKQAKAVKEYFATPEGAKRKDELEAQLAAEQDTLLFNRERYSVNIRLLLADYLDDKWKLSGREATDIHIYLADPIDGKEKYNLSFDLHLGEQLTRDDKILYHVDANIRSGYFDANHDGLQILLYKTFADIISNNILMNEVLSLMLQWKGCKEMIEESIREIKNLLANPLA